MTAKASETPFFKRLVSWLYTGNPFNPTTRELWGSVANEFATALKDRRYGEIASAVNPFNELTRYNFTEAVKASWFYLTRRDYELIMRNIGA